MWCIVMHLSHHIRRRFLLAMRKKYVVKNLQSLMLPDIVSIFPLNFKVIIFQILWRMRNVDCFFSFLQEFLYKKAALTTCRAALLYHGHSTAHTVAVRFLLFPFSSTANRTPASGGRTRKPTENKMDVATATPTTLEVKRAQKADIVA